jgi:hypothetical protein
LILYYTQRSYHDQVLSLLLTDAFGGSIAPAAELGRPALSVVGVGGQNVHEALVEHALGPVFGGLAEAANDGSRGDLHPHARG